MVHKLYLAASIFAGSDDYFEIFCLGFKSALDMLFASIEGAQNLLNIDPELSPLLILSGYRELIKTFNDYPKLMDDFFKIAETKGVYREQLINGIKALDKIAKEKEEGG